MAIQALFSSSGIYPWPAAARMLPPAQALDAALVGALTAQVVQQVSANRAAAAGARDDASSPAAASATTTTTYTASPGDAPAASPLYAAASTAPAPAAVPAPDEDDGGAGSTASAAAEDSEAQARVGEGAARAGAETELSPEARALLARLIARDQQVRQHEQAHLAASGGLAVSGASFSYEQGPDGKNYAVGGEVSIDVSPGRTPEETIERARIIQAAAMAPADPSSQDRAVAAQAAQMEAQARQQLAQQQAEERAAEQRAVLARRYGDSGEAGARTRVDTFA